MHALKPSRALDRRGFLYRAIQLAAATQLLSACGGGGSDDEESSSALPAGVSMMDGQVVLPASFSVAGARVANLLADGTVSATGAFQLPVITDGIGLSQVRDASGNLLAFGFLRAEQPTLSARSTAEALVYRGLGLWAQAPRIRVAALSLLRSEDLGAVEAAVVAAMTAGGAAWASSAKVGLGNAVKAKVAAMIGTPPAAAKADVRLRGMIVTPTERVSGLILEGDGIGACTVTNYFRRRALLLHSETAAKLESGPEYAVSEKLIATKMEPIDGLSSPVQAIADLFFERKSLYTPVTVSLETPRYPPTAVYSKYRVYGIGAGSAVGDWYKMPQEAREQGLVVIFTSVVLDFVVPLLASVVIFVKADDIDEILKLAQASDALKDVIIGLSKLPELVELLLAGRFSELLQKTADFIRGTDSLSLALFAAVAAVVEKFYGNFIVDPKTGLPKRAVGFYLEEAWSSIDKFFDTGEFALTLFDSAVQALDIGSSFLAETWEVTVTKAKVSLSPLAFFVEKNATFTDITATVQNQGEVEGRVFGYRWKCKSGRLYAGGKYGNVIDSTTYNVVGYDALDVAAGSLDQIDVEVFISGFTDEPVGSAKAKVYVTGVTVTPEEKKKLKANESVTLTAATVGMRPLVAGETVVYKWALGGTPGTLTATDTATATFKADATKEGLAVVTVEAFLGERRIGRAQSNLTVGDKLIVAGRVFEDSWKDASGCHTGMYIAFPKVPGAKSYDVLVSGMRGPVFGTSNRWSVVVGATGVPLNFPWTAQGSEILGGTPRGNAILGGGNTGDPSCTPAPDQRWAAWYQGSTVEVTVSL